MVEIVSFDNPMPLHIQLKDVLIREIQAQKYEDKIPSERELMARFSVSRSTVREAVNHLVQEGVLQKKHGKGTFLTQAKTVHDWLDTLNSFSDTVKRLGMIPGAHLLEAKAIAHDDAPTTVFGEEPLYMIARLRTANDAAIAIERHYYKQGLGEQIAAFDLETATIYDVIEQELHIAMHEADQVICCKPIDDGDAKRLHITPGTNVLCIERTIFGEHGEVIEYYESLFHPVHYSLRLKTKRGSKR
ncbi:GntR family transcriptional regulator [Caryophanon latum]|uniref:Transcriptional regulator n=1 Tax=Caryophanon latum TaxID=33977 RepID=A0A1C0YUW5_9BACL|nr:GntR family transcriptional regulator [Caryophanon latum]OCS90976.1 transcriptional regulator [Caryophanon latum]